MTGWTAWRPFEAQEPPPYFDWWRKTQGTGDTPAPVGRMRNVAPVRPVVPGIPANGGKTGNARMRLDDGLLAPAPPGVWNAAFETHLAAQGDWLPPPECLPELPDDTVIVGVIDADVPLGHTRLCNAAGGTRLVSAWQMDQPGGPAYLPFGNELYADDIDRHLRDCRAGPGGRLDQAAFDLRTGGVDMSGHFRRRALAGRTAHGAHVLDVAAGCDPAAGPDPVDRTRIIVVNLPHRTAFGASGEFLDYYMVHALRRIVDLSDAIWLKNHPDAPQDAPIGYPTVINLSFGRQAGVKDGRGVFARAVSDLLALRDQRHAPVDIVTPAGNDNLERIFAVARLAPESSGSDAVAGIDWRIQPGDQSSNYAEILVEAEVASPGPRHAPVEIDVIAPGGRAQPRRMLANGTTHLGTAAAIYCQMLPEDRQANRQLFRILACVAPTSRPGGTGPCAPSGAWRIVLRNRGDAALEVSLNIQTDQSILPASKAGRRSYFDSPFYRRHDPAGRLLDTAGSEMGAAGGPGGEVPVFDPAANPCVRRHGTINATASGARIACLGGYRLPDGTEAPYSSTGTGISLPGDGRSAPTAAMPTDDGYAHFGRLAAGAADGSVVPMRGTSFAAPQATRLIALARLTGEDDASGVEIVARAAEHDEGNAGFPSGRTIAKTGSGRLQPGCSQRVQRR